MLAGGLVSVRVALMEHACLGGRLLRPIWELALLALSGSLLVLFVPLLLLHQLVLHQVLKLDLVDIVALYSAAPHHALLSKSSHLLLPAHF